MRKFTESEQTLIDILKRRLDYCESKMVECGGKGMYTKAQEWQHRFWECEYLLDEVYERFWKISLDNVTE